MDEGVGCALRVLGKTSRAILLRHSKQGDTEDMEAIHQTDLDSHVGSTLIFK